jgi:hypothetical protein
MIYFFIKNWKILLDIILVVGAIVLFSFFDPFGIFKNSRLQATANMVTGVRDIGQLVTAEYYGEVMSSLKEVRTQKEPEQVVTSNARNLFVDLKIAMSEVDKFKAFYPKKSDSLKNEYGKKKYGMIVSFIGAEYYGYNIDKAFDEKDEEVKERKEKNILQDLFKEGVAFRKTLRKKYKKAPKEEKEALIEEEYQLYLLDVPGSFRDFYQVYADLTDQTVKKGKAKRQQIVFIGRGWVKAGFDFEKLDKRNLHYDEGRKTVHFFGVKPKVLDTDINPWFIPEKKIQGFELVDYSGRVTFEDAKKVKVQCKQELFDMAQKAEIIKHAQENGEEAMRSFFSLVLDEPDLRVKFHTHPYDKHLALIAEDTLVDILEAVYIKDLYEKEKALLSNPKAIESETMREIRKELFAYFISQLQELYFLKKPYKFNFYSMHFAQALGDTFDISAEDRMLFEELRGELKIDSNDMLRLTTDIVSANELWFQESDFRYGFNDNLDLLKDTTIAYRLTVSKDSVRQDTSGQGNVFTYANVNVNVLDTLKGKDVLISLPNPSLSIVTFFDDLKYDTAYFKVLAKKDAIGDVSDIKRVLDEYITKANYTGEYANIKKREIDTIIVQETNIYKDDKTFAPVRNLVAGVNKLVERFENN